jgi:hypothetical protein
MERKIRGFLCYEDDRNDLARNVLSKFSLFCLHEKKKFEVGPILMYDITPVSDALIRQQNICLFCLHKSVQS